MRAIVAALVAGALVGSASTSNQTLEEMRGHQPGVVHPHPDDASHAHGDADDHHESPDSPCHHHDLHSCADAGPSLGLLPDGALVISRISERFVPAETARVLEPTTHTLFHVPLA